MVVNNAVIPVAGWGTRFLPASKGVPKELLPLIDKPVIQFAVEEAADSGIGQVVLVTAPGKLPIERYFDETPELEKFLETKGDLASLDRVRALSKLPRIASVVQQNQLGLGHAILMARPLVDHGPFGVLLPDDVIEAPRPVMDQLLEIYERFGCTVLAVDRVAKSDVTRYGIIDAEQLDSRTYKLKGIVEKPKVEDAPSDLAVRGRYILTPEIFGCLEKIQPGALGEIQLTDGICKLLEDQEVYAYQYEGTFHDAGTPLGLLKAAIQMGLQRPDMDTELRKWLGGILGDPSSGGSTGRV